MGLVFTDNVCSHSEFFYSSVPQSYDLVHLNPATILFGNSMMLRQLCEIAKRKGGSSAQWNCQSKDIGRLVLRAVTLVFHNNRKEGNYGCERPRNLDEKLS